MQFFNEQVPSSQQSTSCNLSLKAIDNLSEGHCGYISFIIGALHLVKTQQVSGFIERWKELDPQITQLLDMALQLELDVLSYERKLIIPLNFSLRKILKNAYLQSLPEIHETRNVRYYHIHSHKRMAFNEFSHLCEWAIHQKFKNNDLSGQFMVMHFNVLWYFQPLRKIAIEIAECAFLNNIPIENEKTLSIYLHAALVQHREAIQNCYVIWSKSTAWMTDSQALQLSEIFDIPVVMDPRKCSRPNKPFIHIQNLSNRHWITLLYESQYPYPFLAISDEAQFRALLNEYFNEQMKESFENIENRNALIADLNHNFANIACVFERYHQKFLNLKENIGDPNYFSELLKEDPFFMLFQNCIEAKLAIPYVSNEYKIECLKLLMHVDGVNKGFYQNRLDECMSIRYTMGKHEQLLFNKYCNLMNSVIDHEERMVDKNRTDFDDDDVEPVDDFLANGSNTYIFPGFAIGFALSSFSAIYLILTSSQLWGPALICILVASITGTVLGALIDLMQSSSEVYHSSSRTLFK